MLVVAATADNIAARIVGACTEAAPEKAAACANGMLAGSDEVPWGSNSFIFPITGFVNEPCKGPDRLIGFRHGVTIEYGSSSEKDASALDYCWTGIGDQGSELQKQVALTNATNEVFDIGRIGAVSRFEVPGKSFSKEKPGLGADSFQAFVQANEIRAVETGFDRLMVIKAAQLMKVAVPPDHRPRSRAIRSSKELLPVSRFGFGSPAISTRDNAPSRALCTTEMASWRADQDRIKNRAVARGTAV